jgi:hypothetical protein
MLMLGISIIVTCNVIFTNWLVTISENLEAYRADSAHHRARQASMEVDLARSVHVQVSLPGLFPWFSPMQGLEDDMEVLGSAESQILPLESQH